MARPWFLRESEDPKREANKVRKLEQTQNIVRLTGTSFEKVCDVFLDIGLGSSSVKPLTEEQEQDVIRKLRQG